MDGQADPRVSRYELGPLLDRASDEGWTQLALIGPHTYQEGYQGRLRARDWHHVYLLEEPLAPHMDLFRRLGSLTELELPGNAIDDRGAKELGHLGELTSLGLNDNELGPEGAQAIAHLKGLTELSLTTSGEALGRSGNQIGADGAAALTELRSLRVLGLAGNRIGDRGAAALSVGLLGLQRLNLASNGIGDEGSPALAALTGLNWLNLAGNDITGAGTAGFRSLKTLKELSLHGGFGVRSNRIGPEGARELSYLRDLEFLDLTANAIGDEGAAAIASLPRLASLGLEMNRIRDAGAAALAGLSALTDLKLGRNGIGASGAKALAALSALRRLELGYNELDDAGVEALAELGHLTSLDLMFNGIGDRGAAALGALSALTRLHLGDNRVGVRGLGALLEKLVLREGSVLEKLYLSGNANLRFLPAEALESGDARAIAGAFDAAQRGGQLELEGPERILKTLIDGSDSQRYDAVQEVRTSTALDREALSERLQQLIREPYAPSQQSLDPAIAARAPNLIASIRAWLLSALIWSGVRSRQSEDLLAAHATAPTEPDRHVRFWVLAGLHQTYAYILDSLLEAARKDPSPEVAALAAAIAMAPPSSEAPQLERQFERRLASPDFSNEVWPVLRALRIVPMPALADAVCRVFLNATVGSAPAYDALLALAPPEMAAAAAPILAAKPGVAATVERVIAESAEANEIGLRAFASMLAALPREAVESALRAQRARPSTALLASYVARVFGAPQTQANDDAPAPSAESALGELFSAAHAVRPSHFEPESTDGEDLIDVKRHVHAFASLVASSELTPPLSIGLFGDWGAGKTYFMRSIRRRVDYLAARAASATGPTAYHNRIVQIEFNAWHYVESNLWASLVEHIFRNLRLRGDEPEAAVRERRDALLERIDATILKRKEAESHAQQARQERDAAQRKVEAKRDEIAELTGRLERTERAELWRGLDLSGVSTELNQALTQLGVARALSAKDEIHDALEELGSLSSRGRMLWTYLMQGPGQLGRVLWLLALVVVLPAAPLLLGELLAKAAPGLSIARGLMSPIFQAVGLVAAVATWLARHASTVGGVFDTIDAARGNYDAALAQAEQKRSQQLDALQQELAAAQKALQASREIVRERDDDLQRARRELAELSAGARLASFIDERVASDDYRDQLGTLAMVRRDFEMLSHLMGLEDEPIAPEYGVEPLPADDQNRIDRIILYIDDLDRCPTDQVVKVLQAVHLLLAFPLFVVIVGVDARWVSRSLFHTYRIQWSGAGDAEPVGLPDALPGQHGMLVMGPAARPTDYLEKIFQIPFWLRPMTVATTQAYLAGLVDEVEVTQGPAEAGGRADDVAVPEPEPESEPRPEQAPAEAQLARIAGAPPEDVLQRPAESPASVPPAAADDRRAREASAQARREAERVEREAAEQAERDAALLNPKHLRLRDVELSWMQQLAPLIGRSPRAAKRFLNIYRLIRSSMPEGGLDRFVGSRREPGPFRVAMLLLGAVVGAPNLAQALLAHLRVAAVDGTPVARMADGLRERAPGELDDVAWRHTIALLEEALVSSDRVLQPQDVLAYTDELCRYSFGAAWAPAHQASREA